MGIHQSLTPAIMQAVFALILALLLGAVIGYERQVRKHPAGLNFSLLAILATVVLLMANIALHWIEHRYFEDPSSRE